MAGSRALFAVGVVAGAFVLGGVGPCPETAAAREHAGTLPAVPSAGAIAKAAAFLEERAGRTAFAVVDSAGQLAGVRMYARFQTASVVKVMMLIAFLQRLAHAHRPLTVWDTDMLYPMIHVSDNRAASRVLGLVGQSALARVAREVGMSAYAPGVGWWAYTQTCAADQARLMHMLPELIPRRFYGYARYLMSTVVPSQSWGIPQVARPAWHVLFKTGWLPEEGLFNEITSLEHGPVRFSVAVLTESQPSAEYGHETIAGVGARLLGIAP